MKNVEYVGYRVTDTPGKRIQIVIKQIGVYVQRHGGTRMAEHSLNGLHIRTRMNRNRSRRVPQIMACEFGYARLFYSSLVPATMILPQTLGSDIAATLTGKD